MKQLTIKIIKMKELPILFSTPMVEAIIEGRKTMTRRVIKSKPGVCMFCGCTYENCINCIKKTGNSCSWINEEETICSACFTFPTDKAKYQIGDKLWVRERFETETDGKVKFYAGNIEVQHNAAYRQLTKWKPSIFLFKKDARIWLEVTNVRCERLQDISEADALAEGVEGIQDTDFCKYMEYTEGLFKLRYPSHSFFSLWRKINGKDSVAANPWVFVYEFKRIQKP